MDAPLQGDTGGHIGTAPTQLPSYFSTQFHTNKIPSMRNSPQTKSTIHVQSVPTPISIKPRGVPLPRSGCTFDSAGLASVTQPTLGNDVSEEATPLGVVLFLITHHYHTRRMDYLRMIFSYEN